MTSGFCPHITKHFLFVIIAIIIIISFLWGIVLSILRLQRLSVFSHNCASLQLSNLTVPLCLYDAHFALLHEYPRQCDLLDSYLEPFRNMTFRNKRANPSLLLHLCGSKCKFRHRSVEQSCSDSSFS